MSYSITMSSEVIVSGTNEYIQIVDVMKNYTEWYFKPKEIPEVVAAEFIVELCPKISFNRVLKMLLEFNEKGEGSKTVTPEIFLENYLIGNEILCDKYINSLSI